MSQRRIPRKKGQPAKSKKHSDLYTDEDPKGTIKGLKFATVKDAEAAVRKIKASNRSHNHKYDIVIWASEYLLNMEYLDGWCDGVNEAMSIAGQDMHLMVFHPDYDAKEAGLEFLVEDDVTDDELVYCMVFVQKLSLLDDASLSLEKSGYYQHFPKDTYESLVVDRRRLRDART